MKNVIHLSSPAIPGNFGIPPFSASHHLCFSLILTALIQYWWEVEIWSPTTFENNLTITNEPFFKVVRGQKLA